MEFNFVGKLLEIIWRAPARPPSAPSVPNLTLTVPPVCPHRAPVRPRMPPACPHVALRAQPCPHCAPGCPNSAPSMSPRAQPCPHRALARPHHAPACPYLPPHDQHVFRPSHSISRGKCAFLPGDMGETWGNKGECGGASPTAPTNRFLVIAPQTHSPCIPHFPPHFRGGFPLPSHFPCLVTLFPHISPRARSALTRPQNCRMTATRL